MSLSFRGLKQWAIASDNIKSSTPSLKPKTTITFLGEIQLVAKKGGRGSQNHAGESEGGGE